MNKTVGIVQLLVLVAAAVVLGARTAGYHRSARDLQEKIDGFRAAAARPISVSESPLITDAASLLSCAVTEERACDARPDSRILVLFDGGTEADEPGDTLTERWHSLASRVAWNPSRQLWLVSVAPPPTALPGIDGACVKRCTILDRNTFVRRTGIGQTPAAALFHGGELWLFASGPSDATIPQQFDQLLTNPTASKPTTPFIEDKPGQAIWRQPAEARTAAKQ